VVEDFLGSVLEIDVMDWDDYFLNMAYFVAKKSKDPNTKCGTVIVGQDHAVLTTGYNGMPRRANDNLPERNERPTKYFWYEHSERNAIYNAASIGVPLKGSTAYVTGCPCMDCARGLVQSGVLRVVWDEGHGFVSDPARLSRWEESMSRSMELFKETGVEVTIIEDFQKEV
jgi:dCMP deaminase